MGLVKSRYWGSVCLKRKAAWRSRENCVCSKVGWTMRCPGLQGFVMFSSFICRVWKLFLVPTGVQGREWEPSPLNGSILLCTGISTQITPNSKPSGVKTGLGYALS